LQFVWEFRPTLSMVQISKESVPREHLLISSSQVLFFIWWSWISSVEFCGQQHAVRYHNQNLWNYLVMLINIFPVYLCYKGNFWCVVIIYVPKMWQKFYLVRYTVCLLLSCGKFYYVFHTNTLFWLVTGLQLIVVY
jgi:hypothetical protein